MPLSARLVFCFTKFALLAILATAPPASAQESGFVRFPLTLSPDGAWFLAWGEPISEVEKLASLKEIAAPEERPDDEDFGNYLVSAMTGKVVATIPEIHFWATKKFSQNRRGLSVGWSPDAQEALVVYHGRYSIESAVWINTVTRSATDIGRQLSGLLENVVKKNEKPKWAELATGADFRNPAIIGPGLLVVDAEANSGGNKDADWISFSYRMKIRVKMDDGAVKLSLVKARKVDEKDGGSHGQAFDGQLEPALEKALASLRGKLDVAGREALKEEQMKWIKTRDSLSDADLKNSFTLTRIYSLHARAKDN